MAVKFTFGEKQAFAKVLRNYPIVQVKKTDAFHIAKKSTAWAKITTEFNAATSGMRTTVQLKRLWDKMKRASKIELAEEGEELQVICDMPSKPSSPPELIIDNLVPDNFFEIDVKDDSHGIYCNKMEVEQAVALSPESAQSSPYLNVIGYEPKCKEPTPGTSANEVLKMPPTSSRGIKKSVEQATAFSPESSYLDVIGPEEPTLGSSATEVLKMPPTSSRGIKRSVTATRKAKQLSELTDARLLLIKKEEQQMDELHKIRMEEAIFKREAAKFEMLREQLKLKHLQND